MLFLRPRSDGLAAGVRYRSAVPFERIGVREPDGVKAARRVRVAYHLTAGQGASNQNRPRVVAQIFGLIGPIGDECAEVEARGHHVFVEVQGGEAIRRIPASAPVPRETRIERIRPSGVADPPPHVRIRNRLPQQLHVQECASSNRNMAWQAESNACVSPRPSKSVREAPSSARMGLRTTAGIRSRWR